MTPEPCPQCGSTDVARIVYGYPDRDRQERNRGENVVFGGCMCWGDERDPKWKCRACALRFGQVIQLPVFYEPEWWDS